MSETYKIEDGKVVITTEVRAKDIDSGVEVVTRRRDIKTEDTKADFVARLDTEIAKLQAQKTALNKLK